MTSKFCPGKTVHPITMNNLATSMPDGMACTNNDQNEYMDTETCRTCQNHGKMNDLLRRKQERLEKRLQTVDENFETQGTKLLKTMYEDDMYKAGQLQDQELERDLSRQKESLHTALEETAQAIESDERDLKFQIDETREVMSEFLGSIQPTPTLGNLEKERFKSITQDILRLRQKESTLQLQKKELDSRLSEADSSISHSLTTVKDRDADKAIEVLKEENVRLRRMLVARMEKNTALMIRLQKEKNEKLVKPSD